MDIKQVKQKANLERIFRDLKFTPSIANDTEYRGKCPIHKGNNETSFTFTISTGMWYCHTGCKRGGDIVNLVMEIKHCSFKEAVKYICDVSGLDATNIKITQKEIDKYVDFEVFIKSILTQKEELHEYAIEAINPTTIETFRHFNKDIINRFGVVKCDGIREGLTMPKFLFPIVFNGITVAAAYRAISEDDKVKWLYQPAGFKMNNTLFNYDNLEKNKPVICVEGIIDVMNMVQNGYTNTVAIYGTSISKKQLELLMAVTTEIIIMLDGDTAGIEGAKKFLEKARYLFDCRVILLKEGRDPGELNAEQIKEVLGA